MTCHLKFTTSSIFHAHKKLHNKLNNVPSLDVKLTMVPDDHVAYMYIVNI